MSSRVWAKRSGMFKRESTQSWQHWHRKASRSPRAKTYEKKWEELSQSAADEPDPEAGAAADAGSSPVGSPDGVPSPEEALAAEIAGLLAENNDLRSEISEHEASLRRMQEERDQALENLGAMAAYTNAPSGSVPSAEGTVPEPPLPKTVEEVWQYAGQRWRRQLAFGKDVARGVRGVAHNAGPPKKIVHHLAGLAAYCDLTVGQGSDALPLNNWLNEQNIDASPLVAGMPRPVYHDPIHDRRVEFEMHTKPNSHTSPDRCVRIYYRYDPDRNMVAVGWDRPPPELSLAATAGRRPRLCAQMCSIGPVGVSRSGGRSTVGGPDQKP